MKLIYQFGNIDPMAVFDAHDSPTDGLKFFICIDENSINYKTIAATILDNIHVAPSWKQYIPKRLS